MPDASAARRAYDQIKQRILEGSLPVRSRIDVEALARTPGFSSMPVRQALSLLMWERLVRPGKHSAYEVALWAERELADLYGWRGSLLSMVLPVRDSGVELKRIARTRPYPEAVQAAFRLIETGANAELCRAALNADERLWAARRIESEILGDVEAELETLMVALAERSRRSGALLKAYTNRRVQNAGVLRERVVLKALPNNGGGV